MCSVTFLLILACLVYANEAFSCPKCIPDKICTKVDPKTCYNNEMIKEPCGCCFRCAKGPGEECGGIWGHAGRCANGLNCHPNKDNWQSPGRCLRRPLPPPEPKL